MIIADTDVLVDFLQGRNPGFRMVADVMAAGQLQTTVITCFELLSGAQQPQQLKAAHDVLDGMTVLPLDHLIARRAGELGRELGRRGESIGTADSLIAGIALHHGAALLTRNRRHFERVPHLVLADLAHA